MPSLVETERHAGFKEQLEQNRFVVGIEDYEGNSSRLEGIGELLEVGAQIPAPFLVLRHLAFLAYKEEGMTEPLKAQIIEAFSQIREKNPKRGVHVGFRAVTEEGKEPQGPRTSAIFDKDKLIREIAHIWDEAIEKGYGKADEVNLCLHPFIDVTSPPRKDRPDLPWPGGDVVLRPDGRAEIRAVFGADEAAQTFPSDVYVVEIEGPWDTGEISIAPKIAEKTSTLIPAREGYEKLFLPPDYQKKAVLALDQIEEVARLHKKICTLFGPRRLEFVVQEEGIIFRECVPFDVKPEDLFFLKEELRQPVITISSGGDIKKVKPPAAIVYLPPETFQEERERRMELFATLAAHAKSEGITLVVLAWGGIATSHMVRNFTDLGQSVLFVGNKTFREGEMVRVFRDEDHLPRWEKIEEKKLIIDLKDCPGPEIVGGKAANLSRIAEGGFLVPQGFSLSTKAFDRHLTSLGLKKEIKGLDVLTGEALQQKIREVRERILNSKIPESLRKQVEAKLASFEGKKLAVRSSANIEDGRVAFAGQFATFLNTQPDKVLDRIRACWASAFSLHVVQYARSVGIPPSEIEMAVLIQEMIEAQKGGVIHTGDKEKGLSYITITAGRSAETITSGREERPHQIRVKKGLKRRVLEETGGVILEKEEVERLVGLALRIEEVFGHPQEIEWQITPQGEVYILQTRPLSSHANPRC